MFETLVTGLLTNALGSFIDPACFSSDKINVAVWSGYVVLKDLELRPEVVADHPALSLTRGVVGSVELQIPWNRLQTDSIVITIDDVYALVRTEEDVDAALAALDPYRIKKKMLEDRYAQAKADERAMDAAAETRESGFTERLINKIVENVELHFRRVHVRVEDYTTGDHPFSLGLTVESVHVQSTNSAWQSAKGSSDDSRVYKAIELNHLSVYLDPHCDLVQNGRSLDCTTCSLEEFTSAFNWSVPKRSDDRSYFHPQLYPSSQQHHFLLRPIDASARVAVSTDPSHGPKIELDVNVDELAIRMEESQYCDLLYLATALQLPEQLSKYQKYKANRPENPDPSARDWWTFAIDSVVKDVREKRKKWTWAYMKQRRQDRLKYVQLWIHKASREAQHVHTWDDDDTEEEESKHSAYDSTSKEQVEKQLEEIERKRPIEDILFFRFCADKELRSIQSTSDKSVSSELPTPPAAWSSKASDTESADTEATDSSEPTEQKYQTWGAWMFGWTSKLATSDSDDVEDSVPRRVLPEVEMRELYRILEYDPSRRAKSQRKKQKRANTDEYEEPVDDHRFTITLAKGSLTLASDPQTGRALKRDDPSYSIKYSPVDFLRCTFTQLQVAGSGRNEFFKADLSLHAIEAFDESAESSVFSRLVSRKQDGRAVGKGENEGSIFFLSYETTPHNTTSDASIFAYLEPLEIVLSPTAKCWERFNTFITTPKVLGLWAELEVASFNEIVNLRARTEAKLNYVLANHVAMAMDLRIQAPVVIIPESDTDYNCGRLIVDLGHISFHTDRLSTLNLDGDRDSMSSQVQRTSWNAPPTPSSTSFVKQLYDEAEKGESAVHWKEEFYDKFKLKVTNIHLLLIPYGRTKMANHSDRPAHVGYLYDEERDYELVERLDLHVTMRKSVLPLDPALTRMYVNADLPALTFKMSMEKYYQLLILADRFKVEEKEEDGGGMAAEAQAASIFASSIFDPFGVAGLDGGDEYMASRRQSFLSSNALDKFMERQKSYEEGKEDDSDADSSDSDDTWFSVADEDTNGESESSFVSAKDESAQSEDPQSSYMRSIRRAKRRKQFFFPNAPAQVIDRKLLVLSLSFPSISVRLQKPQSNFITSTASYRFESSGVDEGSGDSGTILLKLQGLHMRMNQRTLSSQMNLSFRSLEVEDFFEDNDSSREHLLFSCPTIKAPFALRKPQRRGASFANVRLPRTRTLARQRERVISIQRSNDSTKEDSKSSPKDGPPENLLELVYNSYSDTSTGLPVSNDLNVRVGALHVNFDQSYVCSLLEMLEETSRKLNIPQAAPMSEQTPDTSFMDVGLGGDIPPLELSATANQDFTMPPSLTESVRADLDKARQNFVTQHFGTPEQKEEDRSVVKKPVAFDVKVRVHSVSICVSDRSELLSSAAVVQTKLQLEMGGGRETSVEATVGDVKVFDLFAGDHRESERDSDTITKLSSFSSLDKSMSKKTYREICGLNVGRIETNGDDLHKALLTLSLRLKAVDHDVAEEPFQSKLQVVVNPLDISANPDFVERIVNSVVRGPLSAYLAEEEDTYTESKHRSYSNDMPTFMDDRKMDLRDLHFTSFDENEFKSPAVESSTTPFFDAIDMVGRTPGVSSPKAKEEAKEDEQKDSKLVQESADQAEESEHSKDDSILMLFTSLTVSVKLLHPNIILPGSKARTFAPDADEYSSGLLVDLGCVSFTSQTHGDASSESGQYLDLQLDLSKLHVACEGSIPDVIEPTGLHGKCTLPVSFEPTTEEKAEDVVVSIDIEPVRVNAGEATLSTVIEATYGSTIPIAEALMSTQSSQEHDRRASIGQDTPLENGKEDLAHSASDKPDWMRYGLQANVFLKQIKVVLVAESKMKAQFDTWLERAASEDSFHPARDPTFSLFGDVETAPDANWRDARSYASDSFAAVAELDVNCVRLSFSGNSRPDMHPLKCELGVQEIAVRDCADDSPLKTKLLGASLSFDHTKDGVDEQTPASDQNSSSFPTLANVGDLALGFNDEQLHVKLIAEMHQSEDGVPYQVYDLNVLMTSLCLNALPKVALRVEYFVMAAALSLKQKIFHLQLHRESYELSNPNQFQSLDYFESGEESSEFDDDMPAPRSDVSAYRPDTRQNQPKRSNSKAGSSGQDKVKISDLSHLEIPAEKSPVAAGDQVGSDVTSPPSSKAVNSSIPSTHSEDKEAQVDSQSDTSTQPRVVLELHAELSSFEILLLSVDDAGEASGSVLSSKLTANAKASYVKEQDMMLTYPEIMDASADLEKINVAVKTSVEREAESDPLPSSELHELWRIVEPFDVTLNSSSRLHTSSSSTNVTSSLSDNTLFQGQELHLPSSSKWIQHQVRADVGLITSRLSYRDLPLFLKLGLSITSALSAHTNIQQTFGNSWEAVLKEEEVWLVNDNLSDKAPSENEAVESSHMSNEALKPAAILEAHLDAKGVQLRLINNMVDQESPVVGLRVDSISMALRFGADIQTIVAAHCHLEAWYHNLRLVASEPLIEPWNVQVNLAKVSNGSRNEDVDTVEEGACWDLSVSSKEYLQLNVTDAFMANMIAAQRAWRWVQADGGDPREMTNYSSYRIRNDTGMTLKYWGHACQGSSLEPGVEEPLEFADKSDTLLDFVRQHSGAGNEMGESSPVPFSLRNRHLYICVEGENAMDAEDMGVRKWQSEVAIPVDQLDSRLYALTEVNAEADSSSVKRCECVIDVFVERGCKFFVVRSTLLLDNNTASDLEVEFMPPPRKQSPMHHQRSGHTHPTPSWKTVLEAGSMMHVPLNLSSAAEGFMMVRPPPMKSLTTDRHTLPKAYAKERVHLPIFDRGDDSDKALNGDGMASHCVVKFHRLYNDRPVRPFVMSAMLSNTTTALYQRTLSFRPPLFLRNLTAGALEYSLSTPNDWEPSVDSDASSSAKMGWENSQQRLRERGSINVADSMLWHLSDRSTPLELRVRMKGFEWSDPFLVTEELEDGVQRLRMKDVVTDAFLYMTVETQEGAGRCHEILLYVPYWIVNATNLHLEFAFDERFTGREHPTALLAGQRRLDREELLSKEEQQRPTRNRGENPHIIHQLRSERKEEDVESEVATRSVKNTDRSGRKRQRKLHHASLLPSVPNVKGILDLLPKSIDDTKESDQLEVLQACYSDYKASKGHVRFRVNDDAFDKTKRIPRHEWSDSIMLDQTGTSGQLEATDMSSGRTYSVGYSISTAKGQYSRTKVIMLTPRFMLINALGSAIEVCHSSKKGSPPVTPDVGAHMQIARKNEPSVSGGVVLEAGAYADFHWTSDLANVRTIRCRVAEPGWSWSGAVPLSETGDFAVRVQHESTREVRLIRINFKLDGPCVCVYFREESPAAAPYRIENFSLETLRVHQYRVRRSEVLLPHHSLEYSWDEPTQEQLLMVDMLPSAAGDNSRPVRIGTFRLDHLQTYPDELGGALGVAILADGPTRVLRFTDTRLRQGRNYRSIVPGPERVPASPQSTKFLHHFVPTPSVSLQVMLQGVGISIIDGEPKELLYISISNVQFETLVSASSREEDRAIIARVGDGGEEYLQRERPTQITASRFQLGDMQIDHQLPSTPFPVLLRFANRGARELEPQSSKLLAPAVRICIVKQDDHASVNFIRHFSAHLVPVHTRVDGSLLYQLLPMFAHGKEYAETTLGDDRAVGRVSSMVADKSLLLDDLNSSLEVGVEVVEAMHEDRTTSVTGTQSTMSRRQSTVTGRRKKLTSHPSPGKLASKEMAKKLYFEEFHIGAIRAMVSFSFGATSGREEDAADGASGTYTTNLRRHTQITVGPLRLLLNAIGASLAKIANAPFHLNSVDINHSFVQADALGARIGAHYQREALRQAYVILGSVDVLGNPMIAWKNMKGGFYDFFHEPVHGIMQSPQQFALGIGRGTLSLTRASVYTFLDFNTRILTACTLGLSEACLKLDDYTGYPATRNVYQGFAQGIAGLAVAPIHSFEVSGMKGVFPGLLAGAFGLVLKPLLGLSLATSVTTAKLRDAVDPSTKALLLRSRPPRHIDYKTKRLKVYSYVESLGEEIVGKLRGGRYRKDGYLGHVDLTQKCFLVTKKRVLMLQVKPDQSYTIEWELSAEELVLVESKTSKPDLLTFYYMTENLEQIHHLGFSLQKHEVSMPAKKIMFVQAMLQQQERSFMTQMTSSTNLLRSMSFSTPLVSHPPPEGSGKTMPATYPIFQIENIPTSRRPSAA